MDVELDVQVPTNHDWDLVSKVPIGDGRVTPDAFKEYYVSKFLKEGVLVEDGVPGYEAFLDSVFDAAFGMALLRPQLAVDYHGKPTLGVHSFKYASVMAGEYYFGGHDGQDRLRLSEVQTLTDDWKSAPKVEVGGQNRVTEEGFAHVYKTRFARLLTENTMPAYEEFLGLVFSASFDMMLAKPDLDSKRFEGAGTLGGHCFRYAGLMARKFYFA